MYCPKKRFSWLSWELLKHRILYYWDHKSLESIPRISDAEYDQLEIEYLTLCRQLGYKSSQVSKHYAGFEDVEFVEDIALEVDMSKPSSRLVLDKLYAQYNIKKSDQVKRSSVK